MVNGKEFAKRLEKILAFYGLSATGFADAIDFNRSTISHLASGRNKPSLEFVMKVSQKFPEVDLDWLVFGKGSFPPSEKNEMDAFKNEDRNAKRQTDLFSAENKISRNIPTADNISKPIEKIVVFYSDGTFKSYQN